MTIKENLRSKNNWIRGLYILLFAILYGIAEFVLWAIVLFQFGSQLLTGHPNSRLLVFSRGLNAYIYQILQFISYRSDEKPYPFANWPSEGLEGEVESFEVEVESTGEESDSSGQ